MILSILRLDDVQVQDIMTRELISTVCLRAPVSEVAQCILETGLQVAHLQGYARQHHRIAYAKDLISLSSIRPSTILRWTKSCVRPFCTRNQDRERAASGIRPARTISPLPLPWTNMAERPASPLSRTSLRRSWATSKTSTTRPRKRISILSGFALCAVRPRLP